MIDLSSRIIQPAPPPRVSAKTPARWHPLRRVLQVLCGLLLVALPLTNGLRLDVRQGVFYFAWHKMAAHDLMLLFWVAMLGVWALVAVSFLYGRVWCGWVCPQTLASDFADSLKARLDKALRARRGRAQWVLARGVWSLTLLAMAWGTGLVVASYWLAPRTVGRAALHPLGDIPAALVIYGLAGVVAADMLWVRRKFCANACPYGAMLGLLADTNTLAVRYLDERADDCIRCGRCETVCPMGIDIKQGAGQMECIGCGECADACDDVLGRRGVAGLIEFRYGVQPERTPPALTRAQKWGLWDRKRGAVALGLLFFAAMVAWQMFGRVPLTASVLASGAISRDARAVRNGYSLSAANGTPQAQTDVISVDGLPPGAVVAPSVLRLPPRAALTIPLTVSVPAGAVPAQTRVRMRLRVQSPQGQVLIPTFFYAPAR